MVIVFIDFFVSVFVLKKDKYIGKNAGDVLAEKLYGFKNFIHNFGNLGAATRKHLVL